MRRHAGKCGVCLVLFVLLFLSGCNLGKYGGGGGGGGGGGKGLPPPVLSSISPSTVTAGGPPFTLTVNGTGFVSGGSISWNGNSIGNYTFVSATQVTMQINAPLISSAGSASIVVSIPSGIAPSNALSLTIQPFTTSACVLFGMYSFFFTGFETPGAGVAPFTIAGEVGVDANGKVSGEEDFKDLTTTRAAEPITGGSCSNGATANEGSLTIITAARTATYAFSTQALPAPGVRGRMAENEPDGTTGSGRFVLTTPAAFFSGDYVLAMIGNDSGGARMGVVGRFTDSDNNQFNTPGTLSNGLGDINDNGTLSSSVTITGGVTVPDLYSRCTATITVGAQNLTIAFYVAASSGGFAVDVDSAGSTPLLAGFISSQANYGAYNNGNLNAPVILNTWGVAPGLSSDTSIGMASGFSATPGTFNLQLDSVTGGVPNLNQNLSGAMYSIDSAGTGRGTMTFTPVGGSATTYVMYLDDFNDGYLLQTSGNVGFGFFQAQSSTSLTDGTFLAGTWFAPVSNSPNSIASITLTGGTISGDVTGTYTIPSGSSRGTATVSSPMFGSADLVFYIFGTNGLVVMGSDAVQNDAIAFWHI